jgi:hypothetical protein
MSLIWKYPVNAKNFTKVRRNNQTSFKEVPFVFQGDVQPMKSRDIVSLTQGRLSSGMVHVFSETKLVISKEGSTTESRGTYVLFEDAEGEVGWYEIVSGNSFNSKIEEVKDINHYEYFAEYRPAAGV